MLVNRVLNSLKSLSKPNQDILKLNLDAQIEASIKEYNQQLAMSIKILEYHQKKFQESLDNIKF